ncbi:site-specific integrase [Nakamurella antarctica]|uniref:Site-specific integrase n=1 Tax=Nakamurella antarctica TaxID=1902245 RepID=A0A3G8ZT48_9ACTN|nr:site-specific integrase [Nakamurella antarctica]AZI56961.1 site-specific integrase [Nakamurella antarctica]
MTTRKRQAGDGSINAYTTQAGTRYRFETRLPVDPDNPDAGTKRIVRGGFTTRTEAATEGRRILTGTSTTTARKKGAATFGDFITKWLAGLDLAEITMAGYRKLARLHITPALGALTIPKVTPTTLAKHYRELEAHGRKDATRTGQALSANTVLKVHVLIGQMLEAAVSDNLVTRNAARHKDARPPSPKTVRAQKPEIHPWESEQVKAFLAWSKQAGDGRYWAWAVAVRTGARRGEVLGLQWRDLDQTASTISIRRSVVLVKDHQQGEHLAVKPPKSGKSRVIALDAATMKLLQEWKLQRASLSLELATPGAYVFGDLSNKPQHPERFSRQFQRSVEQCRRAQMQAAQKAAGEGRPADLTGLVPTVRLHDLRHTHATLLLQQGVSPKVIQERLGHANISITLDIYSHVLPTMQASAADLLAAVLA